MNAEIITIGDEILIGQIVDTNSQWIGKQLNKIGVTVHQITSIQDDKQHILNALKLAQERVEIVIITGGLGPTKDDITKKTIAAFFNDDDLVEYPEVLTHIKALFKKINHPSIKLNFDLGNYIMEKIQYDIMKCDDGVTRAVPIINGLPVDPSFVSMGEVQNNFFVTELSLQFCDLKILNRNMLN